MRTEEVELAGKTYAIHELPLRKNAEWRRRLQGKWQSIADILDKSQRLELSGKDAGDVFMLIRQAGDIVLSAPELVSELVFAYSPELEADRNRIEEQVYESELSGALVACLRLAFPFGSALKRLGSLAEIGSAQTQQSET